MSLEPLVSTYGYAAIGIGTFLEGETILMLGGFAAHCGYFDLPWVILWAFLGTLCGDQLFYYIGRIKGKSLLEKRPQWQARAERVFLLLDRHEVWLILGFRFLYGLRTGTPILFGASRISPARFLILNVLGAFIWAMVIGTAGYLFGSALEIIIDDIKRYELVIFFMLACIGMVMWLFYFRKTRKSAASSSRLLPMDNTCR